MNNAEVTTSAPSFFKALRLKLSARLMRRLLARLPHDPSLLARMGLIELNLCNDEEAVGYLRRSLAILPDDPYVHFNLGRAQERLGQWKEALKCFDQAIALNPEFADALGRREQLRESLKKQGIRPPEAPRHAAGRRSNDAAAQSGKGSRSDKAARSDAAPVYARGLELHKKGQYKKASALYKQALKAQPRHADALHMLGLIAMQSGDARRAVELIGKAAAIDAANPDYCLNHGLALQQSGQPEAAVASYERAIALRPELAEAYSNRGDALTELKRLEAALASYDQAIAINPGLAQACCNRGLVLQGLHRLDAAVASYDRAIEIKPELAEAHSNRGDALAQLRQFEPALASYGKAISINPNLAETWSNRGNALLQLKQFDAALASYDRALALKPGLAETCSNRGDALRELGRFEAALASYERAFRLKPQHEFLFGNLLHTKMHLCDWRNAEQDIDKLKARIERGEKAAAPFGFFALCGEPNLQRRVAETWARAKHPPSDALGAIARHGRKDKIRIAYYSADFRNHPVAHLTAGLFEAHDKSRFELFAFSYGPDSDDEMRRRLVAAFDKFIDVRSQSDADIARLSRELEIDIAIDLGGFTQDGRPGIFALRAAPVQASYLGYGGTMGAEYIDYLIADSALVPAEQRQHYTEKIAYLPSYQANDPKRRIADKVFTREELGLPPTGFVFCCFNNNFKITPGMFSSWMRILLKVEGSVLFLLAGDELAAKNLRSAAALRGVDPGRLIFGKRLPVADHLARYRSAGLFLDTLPCNAGATASDALWAGLPVLTCTGEAFISRVAASLLNAIGLPELITHTQEEYEALAIDLASKPQRLAQLKQKLEQNRLTAPLFDSPLFARNIEAGYTAMYERYHAGLPPDHIYIDR